MPKRPGPLKDFKKRKAKVGKKATKAPNVTKIDLRTKKIGLPTQRISAASGASGSSDARPTTSKGVPLPDLLTQLRHYSPQSRTVALQGLKDLLARHPVVASRELGTLLEAALELLQDPESEVRSALLSFANSLLLSPQVERSSLGPYAMLSCTYVSSAISSLDLAVQRDALAFLDVMVPSFGALLLPHVPMLLSSFPTLLAKPPKPMKRKAPATGKKPDALSVWQARLSVLRTVLGLIRLDPSGSKARDRSAAAGARAGGGSSSSCSTGLVILRATSQSGMEDDGGEQSRSATGAGGDEEAAGLAAVVGGLLPHLKDYLLEVITSSSAGSTGSAAASAPGGAATDEKRQQPGKAEEADKKKVSQESSGGAPPMGLAVEAWALEALSLTLDVTMEVLARDAPGAAAAGPQPSYASLLSSVDQLFPLRLTEGASVQQGQQGDGPSGGVSLEAVNVALLEVLLESASRPTGRSKAYLLGLLQGPGLASGQGDLTARVMALLRTLLPRLQATGGASSEMAEELLAVLGPLVLTWPPSSPSARQAVRLLTDLSPARPLPAALDWLHAAALQLPAWTSAASSSSSPLQLVRTLLDSLLHFCKQPTRCQAPAWLPDVLQLLLTAPAAAKTASQGHAQAPICLLPEASRKRVLELLFHCPALPAPLLASLASLLRTPGALDDETRAFAMEVLHHRRSLLTPSVYLTTLLTTLEPLQPAGGAAAVVPREHVLSAASLASRSLLLLPTPLSTLLPLLVPALTSLLRAEAPAPRLGGLSFLAHLLAGSHQQQHGDDAPPLPEPLLQPLAHAIAQPDHKEEGADEAGAAMVVAMTSSSSGRELCGFRAALLSLYGASLVDLVLSEAGTSGQVECGHAERLVRVAGPKASKQALQRLLAKLGQGGAEAHSLRRQVEMVMQTGV